MVDKTTQPYRYADLARRSQRMTICREPRQVCVRSFAPSAVLAVAWTERAACGGGLPSLADAAAFEPSDLCLLHAQKIEQLQNLPPGLLQAIALVESGRKLAWEYERRPWPSTVRAGGKGWYLPNEEAALGLIRRIQEEGRTSIDVGCMQINLRFHGHAFRSLREALDPASNIAYAASVGPVGRRRLRVRAPRFAAAPEGARALPLSTVAT
jgi:hypothetical protein